MVLGNKIRETLEFMGFSVQNPEKQGDEYYVEFGQFTPAGEDWWCTVFFDGTDKGFIYAIKEYWQDFDVDEETEIWIEHRGQNGVPGSIRELLEDAEWKDTMLKNLVGVLVDIAQKEEER